MRILLCALAIGWCGCATSGPRPFRQEYTRPQMGLPFRIVLYAAEKSAADAAAEAAFARIQQLNDILSDYDTDSELSQLNQTAGSGKAVRVGKDLWRVLERSQQTARETDGAFDVTCGPIVSLWRKARRAKALPAGWDGWKVRARMKQMRGASRKACAVPPVEISSTPTLASRLANGTSPALSETESSARVIFGIRGR